MAILLFLIFALLLVLLVRKQKADINVKLNHWIEPKDNDIVLTLTQSDGTQHKFTYGQLKCAGKAEIPYTPLSSGGNSIKDLTGRRVEVVKNIDDSRWNTIKQGMQGTILDWSGDNFGIEFDDYVSGNPDMKGKKGHCWRFGMTDFNEFFKLIKSKEVSNAKNKLL